MTLAEAGFATSLYFIFRTVGCFLGAFIFAKGFCEVLLCTQCSVYVTGNGGTFLFSIRKQLFIFVLP